MLCPPPDATVHLWLDLEDTATHPVGGPGGWPNVGLKNVGKIRALLAELRPAHVHVFSFAVRDEHDLLGFTTWVRERLEQALGVRLAAIPTVHGQIIPGACEERGISRDAVSFADACRFWGKAGAFRLCARRIARLAAAGAADPAPAHHVLLDDDVDDELFAWPDLRATGRIINVDRWSPAP